MVIVRLCGGIGNQMFQYAAARRVAFVNNVPLKLDLGWFDESGPWTKRCYELDCFRLVATVASPEEVLAFKSRCQNPLFRRLPLFLKNRIFHNRQTHIIEKNFGFDPEIFLLKENVYLDGYWQSEKYFEDIEEVLRSDFTFRRQADGRNSFYTNLIQSSESVALHVRRGDYVDSSKTKAFHGVCALPYYQEAVCNIHRRVATPVFFVFSDDIDWARANLELGATTYFVGCNGPDRGCEDLRLMSLCRHHIIANSSFSWWGAWLGTFPGKIVYAPQKWFNENIDTRDLIPHSWNRL